ncbi:DUF302 domain-containing protein [Devosia nitrariae]|uniref:DUF302 domain-containing protein n=1 Tax=Devosia nitrariae TaxID=2071872 RepID=A0ABQ5W1V5_9HYPH|nr:DUF302 domain-containing protein [Devosia nitrariae]GLQ53982.1 hypothetical protein GCM10010862_12410 [Devosia nitrariae]
MKLILKAALLACVPTAAFAEPVVVPSAGSVSETVERLEASVEAEGARVFGIVDFGGGVKSIGEDVGDIQLVIFGDPRIGAQALSADRMAALDLPGKILVYDTDNGTAMAYEVPAEILAEWDIPADAPVLQVMASTLDKITSAAAE